MYTLSFSVFNNDIYIGGVQGVPMITGSAERLPKRCTASRPKSFIVETLRLMASDLGNPHLRSQRSEPCGSNSFRYGKKSKDINLKYDELWEEHNRHNIKQVLLRVAFTRNKKGS
ncbi:VirK/YbjX family protein [Vibrio chagasii]|nr:VirK/YbjX family protein [Vibrio chagasii]